MQKFHKVFKPHATAQHRPLDATQLRNSAGGYVWEVSPWQRLDRFLILGTEGGSFYAAEQSLTVENAEHVVALLKAEGHRVLERVVEVSSQGRASKNNPALFVLALAFTVGDEDTRRAAGQALPKVARTGTHLFTFMTYVNAMRGWGRGLRRAVASWYAEKDLKALAFQVSKYAQRNGWTHRDALRLSHPKADTPERDALYRYITGHQDKLTGMQADWAEYLSVVEAIKQERNVQNLVASIRHYNLPREVLPTDMLTRPEIWEALLERMPMTAMIRNLATMTRVGLLTPMSEAAELIATRLHDKQRLRKARVHPIQILAAMLTYQAGRGVRGKGQWTPVASVVDALDKAFYLSFANVTRSNKRIMIALDVSGSMSCGMVGGVMGLTPRVASGALALVTAAREPRHMFTAFTNQLRPLDISPRQRLDSVVKQLSKLPFGATDCALPMQYALKNRLEIDSFVILTDSETWFGGQHPAQALLAYRQQMDIPAKLIVVAMVANRFSIADPRDAGMLDVVGFSTDTPGVIADFIGDEMTQV